MAEVAHSHTVRQILLDFAAECECKARELNDRTKEKAER
jgi:hypothetical protein